MQKHNQKYLLEVESKVLATQPNIPKGASWSYIGGRQSRLSFHGLKVPVMRQIRKEGFSFSGMPGAVQFKIWCYIWLHTDIYEVMSLAIGWVGAKDQREWLQMRWPQLKQWASRVDNWAHADELCGYFAILLEHEPNDIYPQLQTWNASNSPWLRRMSIVSLLYYARMRQRQLPPSKILPLVRQLLRDDHHYVQKGVGWTLRECHTVYPVATLAFIQKHLGDISATAFSAVIERMTPAEKDHLKIARKTRRRSPGANAHRGSQTIGGASPRRRQ